MGNPPKSAKFDWESVYGSFSFIRLLTVLPTKVYRYIPSLAGAVIALIIFSIMTALHFWQWLKIRKHLIIYVILGASCEITGFAARIGSHYSNQAWAPFIIQGTFLLVGPLFFAATIYMMLGRTIRMAGGEEVSIIEPRWYTRIFVGADITTLCIQGFGAGIMGTMKLNLALAGEKIVIAGLALQVATFMAFLVASIDFHIRMNRKSHLIPPNELSSDWKKMLYILYTVSTLVLLRCIFRLIEYSTGNAGYLISHEWTLYVFDAVPMFLVLVLLLVLKPAKYVPQEAMKINDSSDTELGAVQ